MAIKTFTTGEVLTASDTNTYLANAGLVFVTSGTLSGSGSLFTGCFSATYDNYRVTVREATINNPADLCWALQAGASFQFNNYYNAYRGITSGGASLDQVGNNTALGRLPAGTNNVGGRIAVTFDILSPFQAQRTFVDAVGYFLLAGEYGSRCGGSAHDSAISCNTLWIGSSGGQTVTGQVEIYGYRKA